MSRVSNLCKMWKTQMDNKVYDIDKIQKQVELIKQAKNAVLKSCLVAGGALWDIKESGSYKHYASHIKTFDDFIEEIGESRPTAYKYMRIYVRFAEHLKDIKEFGNINVERLFKMLPFAKENIGEWVEKAKTLPHNAFENELIEAKTGKSPEMCEHEHQDIITRCHTCQKTLSVEKNYEE